MPFSCVFSGSDWLVGLPTSAAIDKSDYFLIGFGFMSHTENNFKF